MTPNTKENLSIAAHTVAWTLTALATGAILGTLLGGCRPPKPPEWAGGVLDCGSEVVQKCGPGMTGPVATCLTSGESSWASCLVGLIRPATCAAEQVVACVVRHVGSSAARSYALNDSDQVSNTIAERSAEFISQRGYQFRGDQ